MNYLNQSALSEGLCHDEPFHQNLSVHCLYPPHQHKQHQKAHDLQTIRQHDNQLESVWDKAQPHVFPGSQQ